MTSRDHASTILVVLSILWMDGCVGAPTGNPQDRSLTDFDATYEIVGSVYPFLEYKHINWDSLHTAYRPRAAAARGDEIFSVLFDFLHELKDAHVSVQTQGGAGVSTYQPPRMLKDRYAYSPYVVRNYFAGELLLSGNQRIEYGITEENVGYIYVSTLRREEPVLAGFDVALEYVRNTVGLIIDVRHDDGGSDRNSQGIIARLIAEPIDALPSVGPDGTLLQGPDINPQGPFQYTKPVVLLMDGACFSSCEDFAEMMKHVPTVTAVGDTTSGGSGAPKTFTLPSGRMIGVSTIDIPRYDGQPIEWNGVVPDILVPQTKADIDRGRDPQLEYAIQRLR